MVSILDKVHLQKYIYVIDLFMSKQIEASDFENLFLQIRREDNYWFSGLFDEKAEKVLNTLFLDISDYAPDSLFDPNDSFDINENTLRERARIAFDKLNTLISTP